MYRLGKHQSFVITSIMIIAFLVRAMGISSRPIWYDEAFAILFSEKGPAAMVYGTLTPTSTGASDIHPLGYYTLLWLWIQLFGQSLTAVRLLSILAGVATVALSFQLALELFDNKTAVAASLLVALAPFHVHYSQEIRMYSFLGMWLLLTTYAYHRASKHGGLHYWTLFSVAAALAQYTHNLAVFFLLPLAVTPVFRKDWRTMAKVVLAGLGAMLLYLPWLIQLPIQFAKVSNAYWVERPGFAKLFTLLLTYVTNLPLPSGWLFPALFIALAATAIGLMQTFRISKRNPSAFLLLYLSFVPPAFLFLISQWIPVYIERALLPSGIIYCIWLAWSLISTSLPNILRNALIGSLCIGAAVGIFQHVTYQGFPYAPYQDLNVSLRSQLAPGDTIIHSNKLSLIPAIYYDRTLPQTFIADPPGTSTDTLAEATRDVLGLTATSDMESATINAHRVWFIIFKKSIDEVQAASPATHPHLQYLDRHFKLIHVKAWGGLQVYLFERLP